MSILKDKHVEYFIEKRLFLDAKEDDRNKQQEVLSLEKTKAKIDLDKYHIIIVIGVLVYLVLAFSLLR